MFGKRILVSFARALRERLLMDLIFSILPPRRGASSSSSLSISSRLRFRSLRISLMVCRSISFCRFTCVSSSSVLSCAVDVEVLGCWALAAPGAGAAQAAAELVSSSTSDAEPSLSFEYVGSERLRPGVGLVRRGIVCRMQAHAGSRKHQTDQRHCGLVCWSAGGMEWDAWELTQMWSVQ